MKVASKKQGMPMVAVVGLGEVTTDFLAGKKNSNAVCKAFLEDGRAKSIILHCAMESNLGAMINELVQDVLVVLYTRYLSVPGAVTLQTPDSIYSLIYSIGEGVVKTKKKESEQNKEGFISLDDTIRGGDDGDAYYEFITTDDRFEEEQVKGLSQEKSGRKLVDALENGIDSAMNRLCSTIIEATEKRIEDKAQEEKPLPDIKGLRLERNITEKKLGTDHRRLKDIRKKIGLTLKDYAHFLGITLASLSAYIYGRTDSVPSDVMSSAEQMLNEHQDRFDRQKKEYEDKAMDEILDSWCTLLGIPRDEEEQWVVVIAGHTDVLPVTVKRWVQEKYRPNIRKLIEYGLKIKKASGQEDMESS